MKKIFAALLAISITAALAGCNKPADEQLIDDITEGTSVVTEASETASESVSETETSETEENVIETVPETTETSADETEETTEKTNNYQEYVPDLSADMCLAELYFGMSREEAEAAVNADLDEDMLNMYYSVYNNISIDLDENFKSAAFSYGESGLDEITLNLKEIPQKEWLEIKDELISKLSGIYGVGSNDWEIKSDGYSNYCESSSGVSVFLRVYDSGDNIVGSLMLTSWEHRSFKNVEKLSVINKKEEN